jgi:hypothetical protein
MGKRRRASHRFSPSFPSFLLNLEDEILVKGGRICNTHFVRKKREIMFRYTYMCYLYSSFHVDTSLTPMNNQQKTPN